MPERKYTISTVLELTKNHPSGFDYMRVILAVMIVVWHTAVVTGGDQAQTALGTGYGRPIWAAILPMFFALSGFLVSGSLERSKSMVIFLGLRVIRLAPALLVESVLAILILGPVFTSLPVKQYFRSDLVYKYMLNIVGDIHYYLPGVFGTNPNSRVNAQLWTLPYELKCYGVLTALAVCRIYRSTVLFVLTLILLQALITMHRLSHPGFDNGILNNTTLILTFLYGSVFYKLRDRIPLKLSLFLIACSLSVVLLCLQRFSSLAALPISYVTVFLGLQNPRRSKLLATGDYSYGIFLYGYPIQQAVMATFPGIREWWLNLIVALPIVTLFAVFSWHVVEKNAMRLRGRLKALEERWLRLRGLIEKRLTSRLPQPFRDRAL